MTDGDPCLALEGAALRAYAPSHPTSLTRSRCNGKGVFLGAELVNCEFGLGQNLVCEVDQEFVMREHDHLSFLGEVR